MDVHKIMKFFALIGYVLLSVYYMYQCFSHNSSIEKTEHSGVQTEIVNNNYNQERRLDMIEINQQGAASEQFNKPENEAKNSLSCHTTSKYFKASDFSEAFFMVLFCVISFRPKHSEVEKSKSVKRNLTSFNLRCLPSK